MRIALARLDGTVGDLPGNARAIADRAVALASAGADCVAFAEMALCGYPPRDLLQRAGFVEACERAAHALAADLHARGAGGTAVLVGLPMRAVSGGACVNAVAVLRGGRVEATYAKRLLPDYDVFDEPRHFQPGAAPCTFECAGVRVGIVVCEDLWRAEDAAAAGRTYAIDPVRETAAAGAQVIVCPSASPFAAGKHARHLAILAGAARRAGVPVCSVNALGANDDLVFDGDARAVAADGRTIAAGERWAEDAVLADVPAAPGAGQAAATDAGPHAERWHAIVAGIRGYLRKTGHRELVPLPAAPGRVRPVRRPPRRGVGRVRHDRGGHRGDRRRGFRGRREGAGARLESAPCNTRPLPEPPHCSPRRQAGHRPSPSSSGSCWRSSA